MIEEKLRKLKSIIKSHEEEILTALKLDLNKSKDEAYSSELMPTYREIDLFIRNIKRWKKPTSVFSPFNLFGAKTVIQYEPYGNVLIIAPWNYPFQLALVPFVAAYAAGNTVTLKPSEVSSNTAKVIEKVIKAFDSSLEVVQGGVAETTALLARKFDYIFFTGSTGVGKIVYEAAAKHLTPVTLELGGKSPTIIEPDADFREAVYKIIWGKVINHGQTCIAPDYVMLPKGKTEEFIAITKEYLNTYPNLSGRIINEKNYQRLKALIQGEDILYCEDIPENLSDKETDSYLRFPLTIVKNPKLDSKVMSEEIFGPILPLIEYDDLESMYLNFNKGIKPLALYIFRKDGNNLDSYGISSGGLCVNGTLFQTVERDLPFGGVGDSGIGAYHGKHSFYTFTHSKGTFEAGKLKISLINKGIKNIKKIFK